MCRTRSFRFFNLLLLFVFVSVAGFSQETSDPKATAILEEMKNKFDAYKDFTTDFRLTLQFPEEEPEVQKGKFYMAGDKFHLATPDQEIICNGATIWMHLKQRNEVQISDYEAEENEGEITSPKDLFKLYEGGKFIYALIYEGVEDGIQVQKIEFKPTDSDSEYSKMRMTINKKNQTLIRVKAFAKDGSRYTMQLDSFKPNTNLTASVFNFDPAVHPNIQVEDLRN